MKRILLTLGLIFASLTIGCQPAKEATLPEAAAPKGATSEATSPEATTPTEPATSSEPVWPYSSEQVAEAKDFAAELGAKIEEDDQGNVTLLDMAKNRTWAGDSQMEEILILPKLKTLVIEGPSITDMLFPRIVGTPSLVSLTMKNTLASDEGIAQLVALKNLKVIDLRQSPMMTDQALESVAKIPSLKAVRLVDTQVTDAGIAALLALPRLTELDLRHCRSVTGEGLKPFVDAKSLRTLMLGGPKIDDATLEVVAKMNGLKKITLNRFVGDVALV